MGLLLHSLFLLASISALCTVCSAVLWGTFDQVPAYHRVSGKVRVLNEKTIRLQDFHWDGGGIAVYAYYYPPGEDPDTSTMGVIIPAPGGGNDGRFALGRPYNGEDLDIPLPDGIDACDIGSFTIWCEPAGIFFNSVRNLQRDIFENSGDDPCTLKPEHIEVPLTDPPPPEFDNCVVLDPSLLLRWRVHTEEEHIRFQLCGCLSSNANVDQYMGFGVSGMDSATSMFGADPTITWVDTNSQPNAVDYHLSGYTQCVEGVGACPDILDSQNSCNNDATLIGGFRDDSQQCVTFARPFSPADLGTCDRGLDPNNTDQYVVWGVGGLGQSAFRHFINAQATDDPIHFGRTPSDECGNMIPTCDTCDPFDAQQIMALENTTFRAVIGPSGNERGYISITGQPGWGVAWYINGLLIPELVVQRGSTYTFMVEGGNNANNLMVYHPFYLTSSNTGAVLRGMSEEEVVYAGFTGDQPTAVGRLCELTESPAALASRTACEDIDDYLSKLNESASCTQGNPGVLKWTPNDTTPDLLYYQCATHYNLGWKIRVRDPATTISTDNVATTDATSATTRVLDPATTISTDSIATTDATSATSATTTVRDPATTISTDSVATTDATSATTVGIPGGTTTLLANTLSILMMVLCAVSVLF